MLVSCDWDDVCGKGRRDGGGGGGFRRFVIPFGRHRNRRRTFPSFIITGGAGTHASSAFVFASWSTLKSSVSSKDVRSIIILRIGIDDDVPADGDSGDRDGLLCDDDDNCMIDGCCCSNC